MRVYVDKLKLGATDDDGMPLDESYYEYFLIHMENLMVDIPRAEWVIQDIIKTYQLNKDNKMCLPYVPPLEHRSSGIEDQNIMLTPSAIIFLVKIV